MYKSYISLGDNCEAGLQFRRINYKESSFFRFTYSPLKSTLMLIENDFKDVFLKDNLIAHSDKMVKDKKYNICFHSKLVSKNGSSEERCLLPSDEFDKVYEEELSKVNYLVEKWHKVVSSNRNVLYILKENTQLSSKDNALKMLELFKNKYPNHKFTILYLQTIDHQEEDWKIPGLINRYFPQFAPTANVHDADVSSWDKIFGEFPLLIKQKV